VNTNVESLIKTSFQNRFCSTSIRQSDENCIMRTQTELENNIKMEWGCNGV